MIGERKSQNKRKINTIHLGLCLSIEIEIAIKVKGIEDETSRWDGVAERGEEAGVVVVEIFDQRDDMKVIKSIGMERGWGCTHHFEMSD